jgi:hypothetical protein
MTVKVAVAAGSSGGWLWLVAAVAGYGWWWYQGRITNAMATEGGVMGIATDSFQIPPSI